MGGLGLTLPLVPKITAVSAAQTDLSPWRAAVLKMTASGARAAPMYTT